jgi:hypothetical protein
MWVLDHVRNGDGVDVREDGGGRVFCGHVLHVRVRVAPMHYEVYFHMHAIPALHGQHISYDMLQVLRGSSVSYCVLS